MVANVTPIGFTTEQVAALERPFSKHEHGFNDGSPYVLKSALRRRLGQVDPRWTNTEPQILSQDTHLIVVRLGVTLCGVTRYGIGTKPVTNTKKVKNKDTGVEEKVDLEGYDLERSIANAIKSAVSDALTRAAMEFNVGVYLKDAPKGSIGNMEALDTYLKKLPGYGGNHWAFTGGGERVNDLIKRLGLDREFVKNNIEPGKVLNRLSETSLSEGDYTMRLIELWKGEISRSPAQPRNGQTEQPHVDVDDNGEPVLPDLPPTKGVEASAPADTKPSPFDSVILRIMVDAAHLAANDVFTDSDKVGAVAEQWLIKSIEGTKSVKGVPQRKAAIQNAYTKASKEYDFIGIGNRPLVTVVAGPKVDAARSNPELVRKNGTGQWVWQHEKAEAATS